MQHHMDSQTTNTINDLMAASKEEIRLADSVKLLPLWFIICGVCIGAALITLLFVTVYEDTLVNSACMVTAWLSWTFLWTEATEYRRHRKIQRHLEKAKALMREVTTAYEH